MIRKSFFLFLPLFLITCTPSKKTEVDQNQETQTLPEIIEEEVVEDNYTVETFEKEENGWGYRILNNGNLFINQPHIPAIQGNKGFSSQQKAETAANFMVWKLESGIVPPTVTTEELDSINVLN